MFLNGWLLYVDKRSLTHFLTSEYIILPWSYFYHHKSKNLSFVLIIRLISNIVFLFSLKWEFKNISTTIVRQSMLYRKQNGYEKILGFFHITYTKRKLNLTKRNEVGNKVGDIPLLISLKLFMKKMLSNYSWDSNDVREKYIWMRNKNKQNCFLRKKNTKCGNCIKYASNCQNYVCLAIY